MIRRLALLAAVSMLASACGSGSGSDADRSISGIVADITPTVTSGSSQTATTASTVLDSPASVDPKNPWPQDPMTLTDVAIWTIEVVSSTPHDPAAYTQGLEMADGVLYESTGLYGESTVRTVEREGGATTASADLDSTVFGEGLTVVGDELVQISWREQRAFRWDRHTLAPLGEWSYEGEGWGICLMGDRLVMSDGSDLLTWRDPADFSVITTVPVRLDTRPVDYINELECVGDTVIANIYTTTDLIVIDPETGRILAVIDASPLLDLVAGRIGTDRGNVLNGIADLRDGTFLLSGKRWPEMFTVRIVEQ